MADGPPSRTARAAIEARVLVTERIQPLRIRGRWIHQIGLPYHWGQQGLVRGDSANELISFVADPNVSIQESKAFTGNIRGRPPRRHSGGKRQRWPNGFFTDTTVCIGCKACEVACKQWNQLPDDGLTFTAMSYDNTRGTRRFHLASRSFHRAAGAHLRTARHAFPG